MGKLIVTFLVAAMTMGVMAETVNTVTVTKFNQPYPYTGKATVEYTVEGPLPANAVAEITLTADGASATFTKNNVVAGNFIRSILSRSAGRSVRPVRDAD